MTHECCAVRFVYCVFILGCVRVVHAMCVRVCVYARQHSRPGLFEALLGPEDAILSDSLNHASIIDGIRLAKAQKFRYNHLDLKGALMECVCRVRCVCRVVCMSCVTRSVSCVVCVL